MYSRVNVPHLFWFRPSFTERGLWLIFGLFKGVRLEKGWKSFGWHSKSLLVVVRMSVTKSADIVRLFWKVAYFDCNIQSHSRFNFSICWCVEMWFAFCFKWTIVFKSNFKIKKNKDHQEKYVVVVFLLILFKRILLSFSNIVNPFSTYMLDANYRQKLVVDVI